MKAPRFKTIVGATLLTAALSLTASTVFGVNAFALSQSDFDGSVGVESNKSFSRLSIALDSSFKPEIIESASGFKIIIPSATLMDIGVPFGSEDAFNQYLSKLHDSRVFFIQAHEDPSKLVVEGKYKYPSGAEKLANPQMDHFDFRKEEQARFYVDFFYKKGETATDAEKKRREREILKAQAERDAIMKHEAERKASREKRLVESKNALYFCELPFDRANTVFLRYRADHPVMKLSSYFPEKVPDHLFEYNEPKGETEEAQMVRLALKLARENKEALSIKTIEFLEKEYPKSRTLDQMRFLKANDLYRLGYEDKGRELLKEISRSSKGTDVALQSATFLAAQAFNNQEWLAALEGFMDLKHEMPKAKLAWMFHYGIAESLYQIKQADQAKAEYEWVAKNAPKPEVRAEAAFKVGDLSYNRNQFAQAVVSYEASVKKFGDQLARYPQVLMNLSESYFQLENFARAEDNFRKYLEFGRNQPNAWRASLRIAEIKSLNQKMSPEIESAFLDTVNHYPISPGAVIARLRMLPCGNHGGFDLPGFQRFMESPQVKNFDGDGTLYTEPFKELVALTEVRTLLSFDQNEKSVTQGLVRLRENPTVDSRRLIEQAMISAIKRVIEKQLDAGDEIGAIATYQKYGDYLPMPLHDPMADDLKMRLAKAASERKLTSLALKIIEPYQKLSEVEAKEVMAALEKNLVLDGVDEQEDRSFLEAKTLWNGAKFDSKDEKQGQELLSHLKLVRDKSKYAEARDLILALYYSEKGDAAKSNELNQALVKRLSSLNAKQREQVWVFVAETAVAAGDLAFAQKAFHQARQIVEKASEKDLEELAYRHLSSVPSLAYLYENEGETLEKQDKWKEAVALYTEAIENKVGGNRLLYAQAKVLLKAGGSQSRKTAKLSLEKIQQSQDDDVWKRLAREKLDEIAKEGKVDEKRSP